MSAVSKSVKTRKRRIRSLQLKLNSCDFEDTKVIENKLRKVADENELTENEIQQMMQKIVKDQHVLALVRLKPEDEMVHSSQEAEQRAILITETPSVPKLTRSKVRELNKTPGVLMQTLTDNATDSEITTLITAELCSDEDDEEYSLQEEDFPSDDDPCSSVSDMDSNPCTPQTPLTPQTEQHDEEIKYTDDGCFKIPKKRQEVEDAAKLEDLRIATRTRSKLCLEERAIEDLESEFVPPDVDYLEFLEHDITANDQEWMNFLNEFSKPLNSSSICEDDDPINDPEYVAAEKVTMDAEELRPFNISKKELADLFAELLEDFGNEGIVLENLELDMTTKEQTDAAVADAAVVDAAVVDAAVVAAECNMEEGYLAETADAQNLCFMQSGFPDKEISTVTKKLDNALFNNSKNRDFYMEYAERCQNLANNNLLGFTMEQYSYFQQQMRIHVQMLTQTYVQTYCHPDLWKLAPKAKEMLLDLEKQALCNGHFTACNLKGAISLIRQWEDELSVDNNENKQLMAFLYHQIDVLQNNTRLMGRFAPRIMEFILNSAVFMYPHYLPHVPFNSRKCYFQVFAPGEDQLIAMGLEKHLHEIIQNPQSIPKRVDPIIAACNRLSDDLVHGKKKRRIWDHVKQMRNVHYDNAIKFFYQFKHAPPIEHKLLACDLNCELLPKQRVEELPLAWQKYVLKTLKVGKRNPKPRRKIKNKRKTKKSAQSSNLPKRRCYIAHKRAHERTRYKNQWYLRLANNLRKCKRRRNLLQKYEKSQLCLRITNYLAAYKQQLAEAELCYSRSALILWYYRHFKALDIYTNLLHELIMFCGAEQHISSNKPSCLNKRVRHADDETAGTVARNKRALRQEENMRHMLLPESSEDANRKDAVFALNFYERVEEVFKTEERLDDFKKFNNILNNFDPSQHKVADLYHNLEELFLPKHPELAEVFLSFLLPAQAIEVGKFFEHFMICNATTFISKLNIYFKKQPVQIKKIYNCLNELADDPEVTMKKVENKILPLLKGNHFLVDWFLAQFPAAAPPDKLLPEIEHINMKEMQKQPDVELHEVLLDSPTNEQPTGCTLRYINGRIYYGAKYTLPLKLSFLATHLNEQNITKTVTDACKKSISKVGCVHGITEEAEPLLVVAANETAADAAASAANENMDLDAVKVECQSLDSDAEQEVCDQNAMRAHALRLNPQYYAWQRAAVSNANAGNLSPTKKQKSPSGGARRPVPMVCIPKPNLAIACAKKLKSLVETEETEANAAELPLVQANIVARTKKMAKLETEETVHKSKSDSNEKSNKKEKKSNANKTANLKKSHVAATTTATAVNNQAWLRDEDKVILLEMRNNPQDQQGLFARIHKQLTNRTLNEISERCQFLLNFLLNLQRKND